MNPEVFSMRERFLDPPVPYRHLAIIHAFPTRWGDRQGMLDGLRRLMSWGFGGIVTNVSGKGYLEDDEEWQRFLDGFAAAKELGMRIWIYDEKGYPSGGAGGIVLRDHPEYEAQALLRTRERLEAGQDAVSRPPTGWWYVVRAEARMEGAADTIDLTSCVRPDGSIVFTPSDACTVTRFDVRRAYEGTHATRNVCELRRYINVLSRDAVRHFFEVTEGRYFERLGDDAGLVEAVFTDEPSFMAAYFPELPGWYPNQVPVRDKPRTDFDALPMVPWDDALPAKFAARWGYELLPGLDSLFEGDAPRDARIRHDFYQLQSEIYADTFFGMQQEMLAPKGIAFSGHVLAEESLAHHVSCEGNVLADLKHMRIPGIDILSSVPERLIDSGNLLTCKYGSSAAHLMNREQVMSETSDFEQSCQGRPVTLDQRRGTLAVQMALGVTTLTSYYPWHDTDPDERRLVLDFWARLAVVVRSGSHVADFAVLYPARTAWAHYKPVGEVLSSALMDEPLRSMDSSLHRIARTLLAAGLDFDFIDTQDLIDSTPSGKRLNAGAESYACLVIPPGAVMCPADLAALERFVSAGGMVIAFEPLSTLPIGGGTASAEPAGGPPDVVIRALAERAPGRVAIASLGSEWLTAARAAASRDLSVNLLGGYLIARRSRLAGCDIVLVANGSRDPAAAEIEFNESRPAELWDPWNATIERAESDTVEVNVPGYSAMVVVAHEHPDLPIDRQLRDS